MDILRAFLQDYKSHVPQQALGTLLRIPSHLLINSSHSGFWIQIIKCSLGLKTFALTTLSTKTGIFPSIDSSSLYSTHAQDS